MRSHGEYGNGFQAEKEMANRGNFVEVDPFKWPSHREHEQISHWTCFSRIASDFPKSLTLVEARTIGM